MEKRGVRVTNEKGGKDDSRGGKTSLICSSGIGSFCSHRPGESGRLDSPKKGAVGGEEFLDEEGGRERSPPSNG